MASLHHGALEVLRGEALRLGYGPRDYDALLESAATRSLVLLGEATHGTEEFYRMRADITLRLIAEQGFDAVAVEADGSARRTTSAATGAADAFFFAVRHGSVLISIKPGQSVATGSARRSAPAAPFQYFT